MPLGNLKLWSDLTDVVQHTASRALAIFGHDPAELGNVLIRIALASNTTSAIAVRKSLLAFSALHRHGLHKQAVEDKISAIKALSTIVGTNMGTLEAIQHVAAGMLLCSIEVRSSDYILVQKP